MKKRSLILKILLVFFGIMLSFVTFIIFVNIFTYEKPAIVHYSYNGVTITQLTNEVYSRFYYGAHRDESTLPKEYIEGYYRGFFGVAHAYLIFNGVVKIRRGAGYWDDINSKNNSKLVLDTSYIQPNNNGLKTWLSLEHVWQVEPWISYQQKGIDRKQNDRSKVKVAIIRELDWGIGLPRKQWRDVK